MNEKQLRALWTEAVKAMGKAVVLTLAAGGVPHAPEVAAAIVGAAIDLMSAEISHYGPKVKPDANA